MKPFSLPTAAIALSGFIIAILAIEQEIKPNIIRFADGDVDIANVSVNSLA